MVLRFNASTLIDRFFVIFTMDFLDPYALLKQCWIDSLNTRRSLSAILSNGQTNDPVYGEQLVNACVAVNAARYPKISNCVLCEKQADEKVAPGKKQFNCSRTWMFVLGIVGNVLAHFYIRVKFPNTTWCFYSI